MANDNKAPTHRLFHVRDGKPGGKGFWTEVGVAFTNRDGSLSLILNLLPPDGRLQCRTVEDNAAERAAE